MSGSCTVPWYCIIVLKNRSLTSSPPHRATNEKSNRYCIPTDNRCSYIMFTLFNVIINIILGTANIEQHQTGATNGTKQSSVWFKREGNAASTTVALYLNMLSIFTFHA